MARPHLAFRNFKGSVTTAAGELFAEKPWRAENEANREQVARDFADKIVAAYNADPVTVQIDPSGWEFGYLPVDNDPEVDRQLATIVLSDMSITNLFIHVRMHVLVTGDAEPIGDNDPLDDPIKWAYSLFYTVKPAMFRARVREGRMGLMTARDTYSADSWERLVVAGLTLGDRLVGAHTEWAAALNPTALADTDSRILDYDAEADRQDDLSDSIPDEDEIDVDPAEADVQSDGLDALSRDEIRRLAVANNIARGNRNKDQLIQALREAGVTV